MNELYVLRFAWAVLRDRMAARHDDEGGITTLEAVLWIAGLGVLALGTLVVITSKVNNATNGIPTGPSIP